MTSTGGYLTASQFLASEGVGDWRVVEVGACAFFRTSSLAASASFVAVIGDVPDVDDHPPEVDIRRD